VVTACAARGAGGSDPGETHGNPSSSAGNRNITDTQAQLAGRTFLSTSVTGHDLVSGSRIRIAFDHSAQVTVQAGCNELFGDYRLVSGDFSVPTVGSTNMGCDRPLMDQDDWLTDLLRSGLRANLDGDVLTLTRDGVTLQLTDRRVVHPNRPLKGTTWRLDGTISGHGSPGSVSTAPQGITATMRISGGRLHFFDGINDYDGPVGRNADLVVEPDTVQIRGQFTGSTVGSASGTTRSVDMSVLTHDFHYTITANRLTVTGVNGEGLMFVADDKSTGGAPSRSDR
jgi:heat shock protein HslJ